MTEQELLTLLKRGDENAFAELVKKYTGYVSAVISGQLGGFSDFSELEELTSDVFLSLWQSRSKLRTAHLRGWLASAARNRARDFMRTANIPCEPIDENCMVTEPDGVCVSIERLENRRILRAALSIMEKTDKEILIRYYYYGQHARQIAEEMNLKRETVKSRLRRGRNKLKSILEQGGYFREERYS